MIKCEECKQTMKSIAYNMNRMCNTPDCKNFCKLMMKCDICKKWLQENNFSLSDNPYNRKCIGCRGY